MSPIMKVNNINVIQYCLLLLFAFLPLLVIPVQARIFPAVSADDNKLGMIIRQVYGRTKPSPPPAPSGSKSPTHSTHTKPCDDSADSNYQIKSVSSPKDLSSSCRNAIKPSPPPPPRRAPPIHPVLSTITATHSHHHQYPKSSDQSLINMYLASS